jgi:HD-GYP domain-containing protein (c-di-GMP phosphodiesterase class II)
MTSDRPYRKGMTEEKALFILEEGCGQEWDPLLTPLFIAHFREKLQKTRTSFEAGGIY